MLLAADQITALVVLRCRLLPALPQVTHEMMTSKTVTMPLMMAMRTAPIPLTMAMRQLPMAPKMASI